MAVVNYRRHFFATVEAQDDGVNFVSVGVYEFSALDAPHFAVFRAGIERCEHGITS